MSDLNQKKNLILMMMIDINGQPTAVIVPNARGRHQRCQLSGADKDRERRSSSRTEEKNNIKLQRKK